MTVIMVRRMFTSHHCLICGAPFCRMQHDIRLDEGQLEIR